MFDDMAKGIASTLSGVFGDTVWYTSPGRYALDVVAVLRKDVEFLDDHGQVVSRLHTLRIAHNDVDFVPLRDDFVEVNYKRYTLGKRLADDGYAYLFEVTT